MRLLTIPVIGIPLVGTVLLNTLSLDNDKYHNARLVEVYFYAPTPTSGNNEQKTEKIKVWIEDLGNTSRFQFYKSNNGQSKWVNFSEAGQDHKKYLLLAQISKYFFLNQHYLNIAKALYLIKDENKDTTVTCPDTCKTKLDCCPLKDCASLPNDHRQFFYHLNNLNSASNGAYLSPVQAHISLGDLKFEDLTNKSNQDNKSISGSLVYGHVDYWYKPKEGVDWKIEEDKKKFYKLTSSSSSDASASSGKKYFANYPTTFTMKLENGQLKKGEKENDLLKAYDKLNEKKNLDKLLGDKKTLKTCCCSDDPKPDSLECLLGSNFVKLESSLDTIQKWVKDKKPCQTT
ncbi:hypothetical protein A6V39_04145 [Candidatus Mycoplasma haematobovis]|uniref:Uncharacterized protein n=1 Tax=Candidatus Mycoplasma haematobovis TaxID=432608 RepID=A0A1A9QEG4_9MOLU|nr:hypothetical protein [Candidatus Mycoplasma haematobovis]OAL10080.1 hypothetical protein A6V39_04145 [Candidatus Mycoplasma haematobovis]